MQLEGLHGISEGQGLGHNPGPDRYRHAGTFCIREGERLEGNPCDLQLADIDTLPMVEAMAVIASFIRIYSSQSQPKYGDQDDKKKD